MLPDNARNALEALTVGCGFVRIVYNLCIRRVFTRKEPSMQSIGPVDPLSV